MKGSTLEFVAAGGSLIRQLPRFLLCLFLIATAFAQSDRGTITGTVMDPSGAIVPGAKIVATNILTGAKTDVVGTATGNYTLAELPVGTYMISVEVSGFKKNVRTGIEVQLAQTLRLDVHLEVGAPTDTVTVTAEAPMLKTENAEQSMNVRGDKVNELPINFSGGGSVTGGIRNWLSFTYLAPGVAGTSANSEVNGLPGSNFKVYLEGQDSTSNNDTAWTSTQLGASVEAITEFAVQSSNFSAEFGQLMGGLYNFTTKSGTNQLHGSVYEEWANEKLDARQPFNHLLNRDRKNDYGFTVGGPVWIPKIYNGKNHTFFFFNLERFGTTQQTLAQTGTVPTAAYRQGDFSCALFATTTNCTGPTVTLTDPTSGQTFLQNQIFDPQSTFTDANGRLNRTPFPNNVIPTSRLDPVALKIQAMIPAPVGNQSTLNWAPDLLNTQNQQIPSLKIDQDFGPKTKFNFYWSEQTNAQVAYPDGLPIPLTAARPKTVGGDQYRANLDHTISPTMLAHLGFGFFRFHNPDSSPPAVLDYDVIGQLGLVGTATGTGFPNITGLGGSIGNLGPSTADHQTTDLGSVTGSWSWVHGKHTFKSGFEFKQDVYSDENLQGAQGVYAFSSAQTSVPFLGTSTVGTGSTSGAIGNGYASFLLGAVSSTTVNPPKDTQLRRITEALYFQDTYKVTSKLTLELGLRWDRVPLGKELWDRQSEVGLQVPNPNAGNLPGGFIFAGYGPGRCNCEFSKTYNFAIGPRLAAAYQINSKTVLRAGWGVSYSAGDSWAYLNGGYSLNGLGYNSVQASAPSFGLVSSQFQNGIVYNAASLSTLNLNPGVNTTAGQLNTFSAVWGGLYNDPGAGRPARINQWNIALQRQLAKDISIEAAYVGNRGVWEASNGLVNLNEISAARLKALGLDLTNAATRTLLTSTIGSATAKAAGYGLPYPTFPTTATVAQSLRPFPEYNSSLPAEFVNQGNSAYDSLQVKFIKRFSHGLDVSSNYTFSKTINIGGYINADPSIRAIQKGLDSNDYPHISVTAITYTTPRVTSNKWIRNLVGDWTWGATLRYASGSLIAAPQSQVSKWSTYTFASGTPMVRVPGVPLYLTNIDCRCIDPNNINQRILNPAAWQDVGAGTISPGSGYYNDYRGPHQVNENMNFGRTFRIREKVSLNVRAEFFNVFNRVNLGNPSSGNPTQTTSVNNATGAISGFGYYNVGSTSNLGGQRNGQLVARIRF
ncbi:MAG TPA: TonB-dependent receptor [Verrucomicrobiae bacterium]|nr:TonB-dependent receptor [Verrucomicrobiae bacterium]